MNYIPVEECKIRGIYRIHSRNLYVGVFTGNMNGFIGIRCKFDDSFLFTEYHYDNGPPYGTVKPKELIGLLPDNVELRERMDTIEPSTGRALVYDKTPDENGNGYQDGGDNEDGSRITIKVRGWCYKDTGEVLQGKLSGRVVSPDNKKLFKYLKKIESSIPQEKLYGSEEEDV